MAAVFPGWQTLHFHLFLRGPGFLPRSGLRRRLGGWLGWKGLQREGVHLNGVVPGPLGFGQQLRFLLGENPGLHGLRR